MQNASGTRRRQPYPDGFAEMTALRGLPQFHFVAFRIHDPAKLWRSRSLSSNRSIARFRGNALATMRVLHEDFDRQAIVHRFTTW
jgi:hypothetical protein